MSTIALVIFDIDGVVRDVGGSYRRALADTVEHFTQGAYRPASVDIDALKAEGIWNNDWEASQELIYRYFEQQGYSRPGKTAGTIAQISDPSPFNFTYDELVSYFQARYRGTDPHHWTGYICQEPLLLSTRYLDELTTANVAWGFFSGATRASACYVLERRLGLQSPVLIAMEDAPGKPDPTGLFATIKTLEQNRTSNLPVLYVGDTVADLYTVERAREIDPNRTWIGVGILPPHVQETPERRADYAKLLYQAGAAVVFSHVEELSPSAILKLLG